MEKFNIKIGSTVLLLAITWNLRVASAAVQQPKTFGEAVKLFGEAVKLVTDAVVLQGEDGYAKVLVSTALQGRVMTSTFGGDEGPSLGWINAPMIANPDSNPHFNNYGGEDRYWMGPEGGQFSIFFRQGDPFDIDFWYTPPALNEGRFTEGPTAAPQINPESHLVQFDRDMRLRNLSGTKFVVHVSRTIQVLTRSQMRAELGVDVPTGVKWVGFQSINKATNIGEDDWTREKGLLSIWILSMLNPSPQTVVVAPYLTDQEGGTGPIVNDRYFGKIPGDRFAIKDKYVAFLCDGKYRSKFGISPARARNVLGSIDFENKILTIAKFTLPGDKMYVNSMWEIQKDPYGGDVANSYNDGPVKPGAPALGGFYELESSSPAYELGVGASVRHVHQTYHFQGSISELSQIAKAVLGIDLDEVKPIFIK